MVDYFWRISTGQNFPELHIAVKAFLHLLALVVKRRTFTLPLVSLSKIQRMWNAFVVRTLQLFFHFKQK